MRLRLLLLTLLFLSPGYYLFSQHYPINGSSGWGIVDTNGQMVVPRHQQAFVYDPEVKFHNQLSIFQAEDHFSLYRSRLADLETIDFDSLYFGVNRVQIQRSSQSSRTFNWEGPILSASQYYQAAQGQSGPEHSLQAMLLIKDGSYTLLDLNADTLYQGDIKPRLISRGEEGFIIMAGSKSGYWQLSPHKLIPVKYDKINLYPAAERGPACISLKEGEVYHLLVGSMLKDTLQTKGNMRLLHGQKLALQDPKTSNWGVVNHQGDTIVPLRYDSDFSFFANTTIAKKGNLAAVIDLSGTETFPPKYENIIPEPNGTFWVRGKKAWALADSDAELLTEFIFSKPGQFEGPVAVVNVSNKLGLINQFGELLAEPNYHAIQVLDNVARLRQRDSVSQISFYKDGRYNPAKKLIIKESPAMAQSARKGAPDSTSTAAVNEWFEVNGRWGLRNDAGVVLPPRFDVIREIADMPFDLVINKSSTAGYLYGFVDPQKVRLVLKPSLAYIFLEDFEESQIARAILPNGYYVLVNNKGAVRRLDQVNYMGPLDQGQAIACKGPGAAKDPSAQGKIDTNPFGTSPKIKGEWGLIASNGNWLIPPMFQQYEAYQHDVAIVKTKEGWGAMDHNQEFIVAPQHDSLYRPVDLNTQLVSPWFCSVKNQSRQFFFNASGELLHVQQLQDYRIQADHYLIAQQNELWGLIDPQGNWQIKPKYAALGDLSEGRVPFWDNRAWGHLNTNGDIVIRPTYNYAMPFYEGVAAIRQGKRWGYIDTIGQEVSKVEYLKAGDFQDGLAIVKEDKYYGLLNQENRWSLSPKYSRIERSEQGFSCTKDGETLYFVLDTARLKLNPVNNFPISRTQKTALATEKLNRQQAYHHFVLDNLEEMNNGTQCGERSQLVGLLNEYGQQILPMEFEKIEWLGDVYRVLWHGRLGYYSAAGRWIVRPEGYK
ncbi:MAG: WG repeat-containing protein [Bacteroidia bacterium]